MEQLVLIKGAGDLATGIAHRLYRCGFPIVMTELPEPTVIRRTVAFAEAVFSGRTTIEGVTAALHTLRDLPNLRNWNYIPVLIDPLAEAVAALKPIVLIDAIIAKRNTGTCISDAPLVIGVGPGFTAGVDAHLVVETARGHNLGRVIEKGAAEPNTGIPGEIAGFTKERILRAPCEGIFIAARSISDRVTARETVGTVNGQPVIASISGVLRGILHDGLKVKQGMKIGDVDPRANPEFCFTISDKARAIGGGVLEAMFSGAGGGLNCRQSGSR